MSADLLRRAAALMRERAEAATPGPWWWNSSMEDDLHADAAGWVGHDRAGDGFLEFVASTANHPDGFGDGVHIASWHPAVALAVADWLDETAATHDDPYYRENYDDLIRPAVAVARAFLGEVES